MIRFECPHCGKGLRADDETIGDAFNCPSCRGRVRVPESGAEVVAERRAGAAGRFQVRQFDEAQPPFSWIHALLWPIRLFRPRAACLRCGRGFSRRELGTIERDAQSAAEALATGDLPALRALSPEGATVHVTVQECRRCGVDAPIGVRFTTVDGGKERELAHVIYPGAALNAFERLCEKAPV